MEKIYEMSFFNAPITNKLPRQTVTLEEVARAVRSPWLKRQTEQLRQIKDADEARRYKGSQLPYITPAGVFSYCNDHSLERPSSVLCMDLDHLDDVLRVKQQLIADRQFRTLLLFRSPSGDGLKWFLEIDLQRCSHRQWFDAVRNYLMSPTYGLTERQADPSVRNESRACFLCYDPEAWVKPELLTTDK